MTTMTDVVRWRDFSSSPEPVGFDYNGRSFECFPEVPLDAIAEMATLAAERPGETSADRMLRVYELFDSIMEPESAARLREAGAKGTPEKPNPRPIGVRLLTEVLPWLMEVYGLRPTPESSESSDGSNPDATSSTDGVSLTE